jgi:hypothetical protein
MPPAPEKSMPRADKVFYTIQAIFGAIFSVGLFALFETTHWLWASLCIGGGLIGMASTIYERRQEREHREGQGRLIQAGMAMMALTWIFLGISASMLWPNYQGRSGCIGPRQLSDGVPGWKTRKPSSRNY